MKGRTLVIGLILFVLIVVGAIYFTMTATINKIKEENEEKVEALSVIVEDVPYGNQAFIYLN